jgi:hypothetical protein
MSREELVQHHAKGEHVAAPIERPAGRLLGRHVRERAGGDALERIDGLGRGCIDHRRGPVRNSEVEHFRQAMFGDHDVRRLDVAVHESIGVRRGQRVGHLSADVEDGVQRQRTLGGEIGQGPSGHVFHCDEAEPRAIVLDFIDLVDDRDIRMGKRGACPRFRQQPA